MDIDALMDAARAVAEHSPNRRRKVGAVLIAADGTTITGFNTFPQGVAALDERCDGEARFIFMEHAERNAIYEAARRGIALAGASLFCNLYPCLDCARGIVQSGIRRLFVPAVDYDDGTWGASFRTSTIILEEGRVEVIQVDGPAAADRDMATPDMASTPG